MPHQPDTDEGLAITHGYDTRSKKNKEDKSLAKHMAKLSLENNDFFTRYKKDNEEKDAEKKRIKAAKNAIKERMALREAIYSYSPTPQHQNEGSFLDKLGRLNDLNPETLAGEYMAILVMEAMQAAIQAQYWIQQRDYSEALQLDANKERAFLEGSVTKDDGIRVAYAPLREYSEETGQFEYVLTPDGAPIYPAVYDVDAAGHVNYNSVPNTDGTASRAALRANGFVPKEDFKEALEVTMLKFRKDMSGSSRMTADQKRLLHEFVEKHQEEAKHNAERDLAGDNAAVQAQRQAMLAQQQQAARQQQRPS